MNWNHNNQRMNRNGVPWPMSMPPWIQQHPDGTPRVDFASLFANHPLFQMGQRAPIKRGLTQDNCLTHLKLLHAIQGMKEDVGYTDGLWNLRDGLANQHHGSLLQIGPLPAGRDEHRMGEDEKRKLILSKIREKRWAIYVARAVDRYETWWRTHPVDMLTEADTVTAYSRKYTEFIHTGSEMPWRENMLPPLGTSGVLYSLRNWAMACLLTPAPGSKKH
jgi:hypothetical protein